MQMPGARLVDDEAVRPMAVDFLRASTGIDLDSLPQMETLRAALKLP